MPQVTGRKQPLGWALEWDLTRKPAPVYLDTQKNNSREYRAERRDAANMILKEATPDNRLDGQRWRGHEFPGLVQFVPYIGREPLRGGVKLERDIQVHTLPRENGRPLNITQMLRAAGSLSSTAPVAEEARDMHERSLASLRSVRGRASEADRRENPHCHRRDELQLLQERQRQHADMAAAMPGVRTAGLASMNPRLGTCGSLPELRGLRGTASHDAWRSSTPWAIGEP